MKKHFAVFFILFSVFTVSAQNINFHDTNGLKTLLCSKTWMRYYINPDSTVSDSVMDSIKFYANGSFYKSAKPQIDTLNWFLPSQIIAGRWYFGSTHRGSSKDTASSYIDLHMQLTRGEGTFGWEMNFFDGHKIKGTRWGRLSHNLNQPFIAMQYFKFGDYNVLQIWQAPRQPEKTKSKSHKGL